MRASSTGSRLSKSTRKHSNAPTSCSSIPLTPRYRKTLQSSCTPVYLFDRYRYMKSHTPHLMTVQVCTVNLIVRNLETSVMEITPHKIKMESGTVLTQYLITNWTLAYNNVSNVDAGIQTKIEEKKTITNLRRKMRI